jgi:hypothetical protein
MCSGCLRQQRLLQLGSELLCSRRSRMLRSGCLCSGLRHRVRPELPQQQLLCSEEEVLPEPPLRRTQEPRLPQEQLPRQRLLPGTELLCSDLCGSLRLQLID